MRTSPRLLISPFLVAWSACVVSGSAVARDSVPQESWILTSVYNYSSLTEGRGDWHEGELELLNRTTPDLTLGATLNVRNRSSGTDELYGAVASYRAAPSLEVHGGARYSPSPIFSAEQTYSAGAEWRALPQVSFLIDVQWMDFAEGRLHQYKPAVTFWFSDVSFLTARYTYGRAFSDNTFTAYLVRLTLGLPGDASLNLAWSHGTDPEKDPGIPGVLLTMANTYDVSVRMPLTQSLQLIVGAEYEDRHNLYARRMGTIGLSARF
jgi:YaiO family outer membrane protein